MSFKKCKKNEAIASKSPRFPLWLRWIFFSFFLRFIKTKKFKSEVDDLLPLWRHIQDGTGTITNTMFIKIWGEKFFLYIPLKLISHDDKLSQWFCCQRKSHISSFKQQNWFICNGFSVVQLWNRPKLTDTLKYKNRK